MNDIFEGVKQHILKYTHGYEEMYVDNTYDHSTNNGFTYEMFKNYFGDFKTLDEFKNMSDKQWNSMYRNEHWCPLELDEVDDVSVCILIADWAWFYGNQYVIKHIQSIFGLNDTGIVDAKYLECLNNGESSFNKIFIQRELMLFDIMKKYPDQPERVDIEFSHLIKIKYIN